MTQTEVLEDGRLFTGHAAALRSASTIRGSRTGGGRIFARVACSRPSWSLSPLFTTRQSIGLGGVLDVLGALRLALDLRHPDLPREVAEDPKDSLENMLTVEVEFDPVVDEVKAEALSDSR